MVGRGYLGHLDIIDRGGRVAADGVEPLEGDRVGPGGHGERVGRVGRIAGARRGEGVDDHAIHQDLDVLLRQQVIAPLGGVEVSQLVGAGGHPGDDLAERSACLEEAPTWVPSGASGLPLVNTLPLPATPALLE